MKIRLDRRITFLSLGGIWLASSTSGQRIRTGEPTRPLIVDGTTAASETDHLPEKAIVEHVVESDIPQVSDVPQISGIPQVDVNTPIDTTKESQAQPTEPVVPIFVSLFSGPPGPKDCRGKAMVNIQLPKPGSQHSTPKCYNIPGVAQCGTFIANKDDGCQARLFNEPNCLTFVNLAVFTPEQRAVGGLLRSIEVTCGIKGVLPAPLDLPGLKLPPNAQQAVGK
ncbi:hypothetical protein F4811DRAFT_353645 [Daldinia bambusicola]|nr:hypothetical protein F4811DRAFT_353645 [Daldinia bambusicola]